MNTDDQNSQENDDHDIVSNEQHEEYDVTISTTHLDLSTWE